MHEVFRETQPSPDHNANFSTTPSYPPSKLQDSVNKRRSSLECKARLGLNVPQCIAGSSSSSSGTSSAKHMIPYLVLPAS